MAKNKKPVEKKAEEAPATAPVSKLDKPTWVDQYVWDNLTEAGKEQICKGSPVDSAEKK